MNVLIVDDMPARHDAIMGRIGLRGFSYRCCYTADEPTDGDFAWADAVFLDHDMCQRDYSGGVVIPHDPNRGCPNPRGAPGPLAECGCPTGLDLVRRMVRMQHRPAVVVHTANPPGGADMVRELEAAVFKVQYAPASRWVRTDWHALRAWIAASR